MRTRPKQCIFGIVLALLVAISFAVPESASALTKRPDPVTSIKTETTYNSVTLQWNAAKGADSYIVYRSAYKYGLYKEIASVEKNTYTDQRLQTGKVQWYKIRSLNDGQRARKSPRIAAVPSLSAPELMVETSGEGILLKVGGVDGADGYVIYRDGKYLTRQKEEAYLDNDVYAGKEHKYRAVAYRSADRGVVASPFSRTVRSVRQNLSIILKKHEPIPELHEGDTFEFKGEIKSNATIRKVVIGIANAETDKWIKGMKYVDSGLKTREFDISVINEKISIDKLEEGEYLYKVIVKLKNGSEKTLLNQEFEILRPPSGELIAEKAIECAWPYGTPRSKYKYNGGSRTSAYTAALSQAYGSRSGWSKQTSAGASCDVFVGTAIRASGYDTSFPRGLDDVEAYCRKHPEKWENTGITSESQMLPGDVVFQRFKSGGGHISIYLGNGKVANAHYVSKTFGVIEKFSSKVKSPSNVRKHIVYRAVH